MRHPAYYTVIVFAAFVAASWLMFAGDPSPDLRATWIAGHFYALGAYDQIYAGNEAFYTMLPGAGWEEYLAEIGHTGTAYPYVYPPLWAALTAFVTPVVPFELFKAVAEIVNPLLMVGMVWLAARCARDSDVSTTMMTLVGGLALLATLPGAAALEQNQPQILVSFLTIAAIERSRSGAPVTAGAALALAASVKLTPALLVIFWLAAGRRREALAFAVVGAALAALSVGLAGWPLHAAFLAEIDTIRRSVILSFFTYGIDPIIAELFFAEEMQSIVGRDGTSGTTWQALAKPALWSMLSSIALVTILTITAAWFRSQTRDGDPADVLTWPIVLIVMTFVSPLAWGYHYLAPLAFLPHLLDRFGLRVGLIAIIAVMLPLTLPALELVLTLPVGYNLPGIMGALTMLGHAALFYLAIHLGPAHRTRAKPLPESDEAALAPRG